MPTSYFPDLGKLVITYEGDYDTSINTFWILSTGISGASVAELTTAATGFGGVWATGFAPLMSSLLTINTCELYDWSSEAGNEGIASIAEVGQLSGAAAGAQVAALVNWPEPLRYRGGHPRTYLPGVSTTVMYQNQFILDEYVTEYQTAAAGFRAAINDATISGETCQMVAYHQRLRDRAPFVVPLDQPLVGPRLATIRRRVRRAGHKR